MTYGLWYVFMLLHYDDNRFEFFFSFIFTILSLKSIVCEIISLMEPLYMLVFLLQVADEFIKRRTESEW
jgi:hypothetical protein